MPITVVNENGDFVTEWDKEAFREQFSKTEEERKAIRTTKAEAKVRGEIMAEITKKSTLKPVLGKSEKDTERYRIGEMLKQGFATGEIKIVPTGKTGEYAIRMPLMDYTIKITSKKERMECLE